MTFPGTGLRLLDGPHLSAALSTGGTHISRSFLVVAEHEVVDDRRVPLLCVHIIDTGVVPSDRNGRLLLEEVEDNALKLGETTQTHKQPAIAEGALRDVIRLDVDVKELAMPSELSGLNLLAIAAIRFPIASDQIVLRETLPPETAA